MKRALIAATLAAVLVVIPTAAGASPHETRWEGPCSTWMYGEALTTPAKFNADLERSHRMMRRLAACLFARFDAGPVPEYVIERESGWNPWATNPNDGHSCRPFTGGNYGSCGLAQHLSRYWEGRMRAYLRPGWYRRWPVGPLDPRANLIAMAKMVRAQGGVCPAWC